MESESESNEEVLNLAFPENNNIQSPSNSGGTRTPPMYTTGASVPFRWEEEPGKPRPCTALIAFPTANKYLELQLPPRLLHLSLSSDSKITSSSPTTVLNEGPYLTGTAGDNMISNSMRFNNNKKKKTSTTTSFGIGSPDYEISTSRGLLGDMVLIKNRGKGKTGFFSSRQVVAGKKNSTQNLDVDLSFSKGDEIMKMRRNGSLISHVKPSSFLASLCQGIKHVIPLKMSRTRTTVNNNNTNNHPNKFIITPPT